MGRSDTLKRFIGIDFDGTIARHIKYPEIGEEIPHAFRVMRRLIAEGHYLILFTMRDLKALDMAIEFCGERGVSFWAHNENPTQDWSISRKVYFHHLVDDISVGGPTIEIAPGEFVVDWQKVEKEFEKLGVLSKQEAD